MPIKKFKAISCKDCGRSCKTGKRGLCDLCYSKMQKSKQRAKKGAIPKTKKRRKNGEKITDKKIHQVFSWLVRAIYPPVCHACGDKSFSSKELQACHFVPRGKKVITWYLKNVLPGCKTCNGFRQEHVYGLGRSLDNYYGEGTAFEMSRVSREVLSYKFDALEKKKLYDLFSSYLERVNELKSKLRGKELEEKLHEMRLEIIEQTTYF